MRYGLNEEIIRQITDIFTRFPSIEKVLLYGSRAKGTYKTGSDIDLCLVGKDIDLTCRFIKTLATKSFFPI